MTIAKTKEFFDAISGEWERDPRNSPDSEELAGLARLFPVAERDVILDAGCGTGRLLPLLRSAVGKGGAIVEIDVSGEMLRVGRSARGGRGDHFVQADLHRVPIATGSLDAVICFNVFPHIGDKRAALAEFRRILRPGKAVVIAHLMGREELNAMHSGFSEPVCHDRLPDEHAMMGLLRAAGFANPAIRDEHGLYFAKALA